jgi:hypothetical protein
MTVAIHLTVNSQHSNSDYLVRRESGYLKIFFTFLEVNMSNILWSMRICKRTFFPNLSDISLEWVRHFGRNMSDLRVWALIHLECTVSMLELTGCANTGAKTVYPSVFLPCTIFTSGKVAQRSIYNWNIVEKWCLNTHSLI